MAKWHYLDQDIEESAMMVSTEPNLHRPLRCNTDAPHFGSVQTQYPMHAIDRSWGVSIYCTAMKRINLASSTNLVDAEIMAGMKILQVLLFTIYGLAVTVWSKRCLLFSLSLSLSLSLEQRCLVSQLMTSDTQESISLK